MSANDDYYLVYTFLFFIATNATYTTRSLLPDYHFEHCICFLDSFFFSLSCSNDGRFSPPTSHNPLSISYPSPLTLRLLLIHLFKYYWLHKYSRILAHMLPMMRLVSSVTAMLLTCSL